MKEIVLVAIMIKILNQNKTLKIHFQNHKLIKIRFRKNYLNIIKVIENLLHVNFANQIIIL